MLWVSFLNAVFVYITFSVFYMEFFFLVIFSSFFNQDSNPLSLIWSCICLGQCYDLPFYLHYSVFHKNFAKILKNHWIYQYCPSWFLLLLSCLRNSFLYSVHKDVVLYFHLFLGGTIFKVFIEFIGILFLFYLLMERHVGSWLPDQESNLSPLHWQSLNHWTTRKVPICYFFFFGGPKILVWCQLWLPALKKGQPQRRQALACSPPVPPSRLENAQNVLQDAVKPRMTPQASRDWRLSLATPASFFQFILRPQLAPSWLCPGQADRRRQQGWALGPRLHGGGTRGATGRGWGPAQRRCRAARPLSHRLGRELPQAGVRGCSAV